MAEMRKYALDRDGCYNLHFPNKHGLSIDEITVIFAKFGDVVSVTTAGDDYGFRFVRYKLEEEAQRAVEGLRNDKFVRILPKRTNNNSCNRNRPNFNKNNQSSETNRGYSDKSLNAHDNDSRQRDFSRGSDAIGKFGKSAESQTATKINEDPAQPEYQCTRDSNKMVLVQSTSVADVQDDPDTCAPLPITTVLDDAARTSENSCIQRDSSETRERLDNAESTSRSPEEPKTIQAEPIVVANIHSDFSVNYILDLFQKYHPISVSAMKSIPSTRLRYCIVYLGSIRQARAMEREFGNFVLSGKDLLVLRAQKLVASLDE